MNTILEKAKNKIYKHKSWFAEGNKSVYYAIKYFVDSKDFFIDTNIKYTSQIPEYKGEANKKNVISYLINNNMIDKLVIRYNGTEGGTDKGKLKIKTFLELKRIKERLEYLRGEILNECISYGEIAELEYLKDHIENNDVLLLQWANVPESEG